jgi:hypothetical protein
MGDGLIAARADGVESAEMLAVREGREHDGWHVVVIVRAFVGDRYCEAVQVGLIKIEECPDAPFVGVKFRGENSNGLHAAEWYFCGEFAGDIGSRICLEGGARVCVRTAEWNDETRSFASGAVDSVERVCELNVYLVETVRVLYTVATGADLVCGLQRKGAAWEFRLVVVAGASMRIRMRR